MLTSLATLLGDREMPVQIHQDLIPDRQLKVAEITGQKRKREEKKKKKKSKPCILCHMVYHVTLM